MSVFKVGDIVARKSYGGDVYFRVTDITSSSGGKLVYHLKGLLYRIFADAHEEDLVKKDSRQVRNHMHRNLMSSGFYRFDRSIPNPLRFLYRIRGTPGRILHMDSSSDYLDMCRKYYNDANLKAYGKVIPESEQPGYVRSLLQSTHADILIVTGHDGIKKDAPKLNNVDSYRNSKYYIQSVKEARKYEQDMDKLCIFAGACQSYYEGIMDAGANFASSPGRILIHALDPAKVADKVALTDSRSFVTPQQIASITESGSEGIGGVRTKGHFMTS